MRVVILGQIGALRPVAPHQCPRPPDQFAPVDTRSPDKVLGHALADQVRNRALFLARARLEGGKLVLGELDLCTDYDGSRSNMMA